MYLSLFKFLRNLIWRIKFVYFKLSFKFKFNTCPIWVILPHPKTLHKNILTFMLMRIHISGPAIYINNKISMAPSSFIWGKCFCITMPVWSRKTINRFLIQMFVEKCRMYFWESLTLVFIAIKKLWVAKSLIHVTFLQ